MEHQGGLEQRGVFYKAEVGGTPDPRPFLHFPALIRERELLRFRSSRISPKGVEGFENPDPKTRESSEGANAEG